MLSAKCNVTGQHTKTFPCNEWYTWRVIVKRGVIVFKIRFSSHRGASYCLEIVFQYLLYVAFLYPKKLCIGLSTPCIY